MRCRDRRHRPPTMCNQKLLGQRVRGVTLAIMSVLCERSRGSSLLGAGFTCTVLGLLLIVLGSPTWVVVVGLLLVSANVATLIAFVGAHRVSEPTSRRLALAILLTLVVAPPAVFLGLQRSPAEATLSSIEPTPGAAMVFSGLETQGALTRGSSAPVLAAFGSLELADLEPPSGSKLQTATKLLVGVPVRARDCADLEARLGGSCHQSGSPRYLAEPPLTIRSPGTKHSLIAELRPKGVRSLELSESTSLSQQSVPTEWTVAAEGGQLDVDVRCRRGTQLLIEELSNKARSRCGSGDATFYLLLAPASGSSLAIFANELSEFEAHLGAERVETTVEGGHLAISGASRDLPVPPVPIDFQASSGHSFDLELRQSVQTGRNHITLESDRATRMDIGGHNLVPSWPQQHSNLVYFLLGVLATVLVSAIFDFAVHRLTR